ncbi:MAG: hypothetical protein IMZ66_06310 [Planctomycetes bacterium]|nr:hypothetical protein [Planctomycetota bacterium]
MKRRCPKCGSEWEIRGPIGFREECPECAAFMHTCANCRHDQPATRSCAVPNTEPVRDRESVNFCEEFEFLPPGEAQARPAPPQAGPAKGNDGRRRFEDLFRDPPA